MTPRASTNPTNPGPSSSPASITSSPNADTSHVAAAQLAQRQLEPLAVLHVMAWACLLLTLFLLGLGALVTSHNAGMAVPDGETTFGQTLWLYNWWDKPFGVQLEHTHRLAGMTVGLAALAFYLTAFFHSQRTYFRWAVACMLASVILQGLLGRFRVDFNAVLGIYYAPLHGAFAQLVFGQMAVLVLLTSRWWRDVKPAESERAAQLHWLSTALVALTFVQILLGVAFRHWHIGFYIHAALAYALLIFFMAYGAAVLVDPAARKRLGPPLALLALVVTLQIMLGNAAALVTGLLPRELREFTTNQQAFVTAGHVLLGSVFFATTIVTAVAARRTLQPQSGEAS